MSLRIKKGDTVKVITGSDKGQTGKVIAVDPKTNLVKVENLNMVSRHRKGRTAQEQSGIIKMEGNINISNVMLVCPSCEKATRIATIEVDGKNHRQCKHCGFDIDSKKAEKKETKKRSAKADEKTEKTSTSRVKRTRKSQKDSDSAEK
ncbi:MAG: 50S ribosomal protein L24 [Clostridiales bacterium]|nr:50S ribosomal protein L24 [Clostridiales bacterium]